MSSLAQEESRSISENVVWGRRKSFQDGKVSLAYSSFLGYDRGENGEMVINPEQAKTVRLIYKLFLEGYTYNAICKHLEISNIKTPRGKEKWSPKTILSILTNEKYKGDAMLQKTFTVDFLQKKTKKNEGEVPMYYVKDNHPAIIDKEDWDLVQAEMIKRKNLVNKYTSSCILTTKLICGCCSGSYVKKIWHSTDKYRTEILRCNNKYENHTGCNTTHFKIDDVKSRFLDALNSMLKEYDSIKTNVAEQILYLSDISALENEALNIQSDIDITLKTIDDCVKQNARTIQDQDEYQKRYSLLEEKYEKLEKKKSSVEERIMVRKARNIELQKFNDSLQSTPAHFNEWDDYLWIALLEKAVAKENGKIDFHFKNGAIIEN